MTTTERHDLISVITDDHRQVEAVFSELEKRTGSPQHRRDLADHVIAELVRHSVAEEQYMYPAARKHLPNGDQIADHEIAEHAEAEQVMKQLENVEPTDPRFDQLLGQLIADIRHHVEDEENDLLPKLQQACSEEELRELGEKVLRAKEIAPTRPHPSAPDKPPANRILDPGAGLIDKIRDGLSGRSKNT
ncbi:Hemerythrin HHE cation binding domain-containing protein [Amycolatopsis arida]|uniref:Hemerythrin HHE cation binding domain-containing protein n=1 Tax=Amycolatopsis arida TaxID=587909 RepID=A0A1I5ZRB8_9PSEU|nr:hemerythrin domain-containing protein [Amycolatopsis arida]TDX89302.1 hemerythrin HHE cation binding domain-containing protein [Amycolatopsis arida]SFQ58913.1 Hemerythrin HHE cation binding domain-containing protein [Amycolatopsis arida]